MLFIIFVYYFVQGALIDANPISSIDNRLLAANHCADLTLTFRVRRSETQLCRLLSIAFLCSFVRCLYPSMFWLGQLGSS